MAIEDFVQEMREKYNTPKQQEKATLKTDGKVYDETDLRKAVLFQFKILSFNYYREHQQPLPPTTDNLQAALDKAREELPQLKSVPMTKQLAVDMKQSLTSTLIKTDPIGRGGKPVDISGRQYGVLTAVGMTGYRASTTGAEWVCQCQCGGVTLAPAAQLNNGQRTSCAKKGTSCPALVKLNVGLHPTPKHRRIYGREIKAWKRLRDSGNCPAIWHDDFERFRKDVSEPRDRMPPDPADETRYNDETGEVEVIRMTWRLGRVDKEKPHGPGNSCWRPRKRDNEKKPKKPEKPEGLSRYEWETVQALRAARSM
jgi:hypothetical protein